MGILLCVNLAGNLSVLRREPRFKDRSSDPLFCTPLSFSEMGGCWHDHVLTSLRLGWVAQLSLWKSNIPLPLSLCSPDTWAWVQVPAVLPRSHVNLRHHSNSLGLSLFLFSKRIIILNRPPTPARSLWELNNFMSVKCALWKTSVSSMTRVQQPSSQSEQYGPACEFGGACM